MTIRTKEEALLKAVLDNSSASLHPTGTILIDDTDEHTGPYFSVTALVDSTIDHSACTTNITDGADFILPKGATMYGSFTSIALLAGGKVLAYSR